MLWTKITSQLDMEGANSVLRPRKHLRADLMNNEMSAATNSRGKPVSHSIAMIKYTRISL